MFLSSCLHGAQCSLSQLLLTSIVTPHIILTAATRALGGREGREVVVSVCVCVWGGGGDSGERGHVREKRRRRGEDG